MKTFILFLSALMCCGLLIAQNSQTKFLELTASNPQPRLHEYSTFSINIEPITRLIIQSIPKNQREGYNRVFSDSYSLLIKQTDSKGVFEIGPFDFTLNDIHYITNKIKYEVIDTLPFTDEGLWIRVVKQSDSTFCVITEQNIPSDSARKFTLFENLKNKSKPDYIASFARGYDNMDVVRVVNGSSTRGFKSININGEEKNFEFSRNLYFIEITDKEAKIIITQKDFVNLPLNYTFMDFKIR